ncbi:hypothetical protein PO878_18610 [Iamia majanohamensis]|uniref:Uncharacterized protein n=1 Tax=Iamia majanohamensis TaxID=467976 RepID=A0AAE9Y8N2_9ACTN|nr:hypothetical protein [Iamia majanohamensis]WCO66513.1 hypothetical protein PO878_18610 [Iamia majanohamensis]
MPADPPAVTPGPVPPGPPRDALALGAALGAGAWWCDQVFAVAGGWVPTTPEAAARIHLAELSRVVGDHGVALRRHLPRPTGTDPEAWVAPPSAGAEEAVAALAGLEATPARLAGLHRGLVPRLLVLWDAHRRDPSPADRGVARTVGHAHHDLAALWHDGEALLEAALDADPDLGAALAGAVTAVEGPTARGGGLVGPPPAAPPGADPTTP